MEAWAFQVGLTAGVVAAAAGRLPRKETRKTKGGTLIVSPAGQRALWEELGLSEIGAEKTGVAAREEGPVTLVVERCPVNRHMLLCRLGEVLVRVRVRDNALFVPKMTIVARKTAGAAEDMYELAQRHPRRKGERV